MKQPPTEVCLGDGATSLKNGSKWIAIYPSPEWHICLLLDYSCGNEQVEVLFHTALVSHGNVKYKRGAVYTCGQVSFAITNI